MRETPCPAKDFLRIVRITPAYAGNTEAKDELSDFLAGSPPRMRETPHARGYYLLKLQDHPRVCGKHLSIVFPHS